MISSTAQAVLLLTARLSKAGEGESPLTSREWGRFAEWLKEKSLTPEHLLSGRVGELLNNWHDKGITASRLEGLLGRGPALALLAEKWERAGLWVMTRADHDYPRRLKQRLGSDSPAVLFGSGNRNLLNSGGLAVIGSRNANDADLAYSREFGAAAAAKGLSIVSGGARGVDEAAMLGALAAEGTAIGVLPDSLLRASTSPKYRRYLMSNNLVLISPFNPDAGFNVGSAMQRNKYIYCLADAALVVQSGTSGGTWTGALENLKNRWVPLWVKRTADPDSGNAILVKEGAAWVSGRVQEVDPASLFSTVREQAAPTAGLFDESPDDVSAEGQADLPTPIPEPVFEQPNQSTPACSVGETSLADVSFYELFLTKIAALPPDTPISADDLVKTLEINKTQVSAWLKQAVADGKLKKKANPVRYEIVVSRQAVLPID